MKSYFLGFFKKILDNLSSVKVWMFILPFIVSIFFLNIFFTASISYTTQILSANVSVEVFTFITNMMVNLGNVFLGWCTFIVSLVGTIVVIREVFKVSKIKALTSSKNNKDVQEIKD